MIGSIRTVTTKGMTRRYSRDLRETHLALVDTDVSVAKVVRRAQVAAMPDMTLVKRCPACLCRATNDQCHHLRVGHPERL